MHQIMLPYSFSLSLFYVVVVAVLNSLVFLSCALVLHSKQQFSNGHAIPEWCFAFN